MGRFSHDRFTRLLASGDLDLTCLWKQAKSLVEEMVDSTDHVVIGVDVTVQEKPYSRVNELVCWHYDHNKGATVKGIQLLSAVLTTKELVVPIGIDFIRKLLSHKAADRRNRITKTSASVSYCRYVGRIPTSTMGRSLVGLLVLKI